MDISHIASDQHNCWVQQEIVSRGTSSDTLELTGEKKQKVLGFGGCFNEMGWEALAMAGDKDREAFLDELFLPQNANFNFGRIPIGANDFSLEWYSCDEVDGDYDLKHFNIDRDKVYTIPFIREAQKRQAKISLFASPWSPPTWMKTKKAYNFGRLRMEKEVLDAYANYFVKFVQAYAEQDIPVTQVHVQNEPMADQKFPSCLWSGEDMLVFIRDHLGPAFQKSGLPTELWLGTINGPFMDFMIGHATGLSWFYDQFANTVLSDKTAKNYLSGVGVQWGGKHIIEQVESGHPDMRIMQTESECGDGQNSWEHMEYIYTQMWYYFRHGAERYTYWNMALPTGESSTWGWSQNSLCTVDPATGRLALQPEFYLMKHLSHFVQAGAQVLCTKGCWSTGSMAFENPDGSIVLTVSSNMNKDRQMTFIHDGQTFSAEIKAHSLHTFQISK